MKSELSVTEILTNLEQKLAHHRAQEKFHAEQEVHHREQRAVHAGEIERVAKHLEAFKAVAPPVLELATPIAPPPPDDSDLGPKPRISRLIGRVVAALPAGELFTPTSVAAAVNRRFPTKLRRPIDGRLASVTLRRLRDAGEIRLVQEGKAHHEATYAKRPPSPPTAQ